MNTSIDPFDDAKEKMTPGLRTRIGWALRMHANLLWLGRGNPAVLRHYLMANVRYLLVKLGLRSDAGRQIAEVRGEFETRAAMGQFKERWFDVNVVPWCLAFSAVFDRSDPIRILEIGSWEGRSSLFLLTYFKNGELTAVDTWAGGDEYEYNATSDLQDLESRFDNNLRPCTERLTKRKGLSMHVLPQLLAEQQRFDVIYVDGSHFADDILTDAIVAWRLLKQDGVMIFDDVLSPFYLRTHANPAWAMNSFLKYYKGDYKLLSAGYQILLQKTADHTDEVHGDVADLAAFQYNDG